MPKRQEKLLASRIGKDGQRVYYLQRFTVGSDLEESDIVRDGVVDPKMLLWDAPEERMAEMLEIASNENITPKEAYQMMQAIFLQDGHIARPKQNEILEALIKNSNTPPLIRKQLQYFKKSFSSDVFDLIALAKESDLGPELVYKLATSISPDVRKEIAARGDIFPDLLDELAKDPKPEVRRRVAGRYDLSAELVKKLARDIDPDVRLLIAYEDSLPPEVMTALANDRAPEVQKVIRMKIKARKEAASVTELDLQSEDITSMLSEAPIYKKTAVVDAVRATEPTVVETVLADGTVETENVAQPGDYIVTNPGGEQYVMSGEKFTERYTPKGDGSYQAKGSVRVIQNPTGAPISITAPWGEKQYGDERCYVVSAHDPYNPDDVSTDRYIVGYEEFNETYG
jgi:hypothetical protein